MSAFSQGFVGCADCALGYRVYGRWPSWNLAVVSLAVNESLSDSRPENDDVTASGYSTRSISRAALRPQAPITPPPGWLAAPQRYSPPIGVR